ncbi:DUF2937 family protein [Algihabitans albus]|uniref:DUF2937 family protein n=1 Tax=Algihabitans albus TaxID=2164067 RepID=UPI0013C34DE2|nr:DUF2937 family protein [Algihabitans albus]
MIGRLANAIFGGAGALAAGQAPAFYTQYLQRLGGRLDQAVATVERIRADAAARGENLSDYIALSLADTSTRAQEAGQRALEAVQTRDALREAYTALTMARPFERPQVFAEHFDSGLAEATLSDFVPALPVSPEGLVYAAIGLLVGLAVLAGMEATGRALLGGPKTDRRVN